MRLKYTDQTNLINLRTVINVYVGGILSPHPSIPPKVEGVGTGYITFDYYPHAKGFRDLCRFKGLDATEIKSELTHYRIGCSDCRVTHEFEVHTHNQHDYDVLKSLLDSKDYICITE